MALSASRLGTEAVLAASLLSACAVPSPVSVEGIDTSFARSGHVLRVRTGDWTAEVLFEPEGAEGPAGHFWDWESWSEQPRGTIAAFSQNLRTAYGAQASPARWRAGVLDLETGARTYLLEGASALTVGRWDGNRGEVVVWASPGAKNLTGGDDIPGFGYHGLAGRLESGEWTVRWVLKPASWEEAVERSGLPDGLIEQDFSWIRYWQGKQGRWIFITDLRFKGLFRWYDSYLVGASLETGEVRDILRLPEGLRESFYDR